MLRLAINLPPDSEPREAYKKVKNCGWIQKNELLAADDCWLLHALEFGGARKHRVHIRGQTLLQLSRGSNGAYRASRRRHVE